MALAVKNLLANTGYIRDVGLISGLGRSLGAGNGNPLHENSMDKGDRWAAVHGVAKS